MANRTRAMYFPSSLMAREEILELIRSGDEVGLARRLDEGADRNINFNDTFLSNAICEQQEGIVRLLVSEGANLNIRVEGDLEAIHMAARYSNVNIMQILIDGGADVNRQSEFHGLVAVYVAAKWKQRAMVRFLLDHGADATVQVSHSVLATTAFHRSIENVDLAMMELFLAAGVPLDLRDGNQNQPLHIAAAEDKDGFLVRRLLNCGADLNAVDKFGDTPLHVAVHKGNFAAISALCIKGADLNRLNARQLTPAHVAVDCNQLEALQLLIEFGANVDKPGNDNMTPLLFSHNGMMNKLPLRRRTPSVSLVCCCSRDTIGEMCRWHLNYVCILETLIRVGCDMNKMDVKGQRLLNYLVQGGFQTATALRLLLMEGADHDLCTIQGTTLLMAAASSSWSIGEEYKYEGYRNVIRLVLRYCPSLIRPPPPILPSADGVGRPRVGVSVSALVVAARYRDVELVTEMLESGYRPTQGELIKITGEDWSGYPSDQEKFSVIKKLVEFSISNPPSLLLSCIVAVRMILNHQLYQRVTQLNIPNPLKDLLLLKHVLRLSCAPIYKELHGEQVYLLGVTRT